jgi:hypothetical protein
MYFNGYNYSSIFKLLNNKKSVTPQELAKHIVTSFPKKDNYPDENRK